MGPLVITCSGHIIPRSVKITNIAALALLTSESRSAAQINSRSAFGLVLHSEAVRTARYKPRTRYSAVVLIRDPVEIRIIFFLKAFSFRSPCKRRITSACSAKHGPSTAFYAKPSLVILCASALKPPRAQERLRVRRPPLDVTSEQRHQAVLVSSDFELDPS
jgi:hypothetical protein